jgi:uncharacterized membrane protein YdjX (TVP38/TMEM64 family)
MRQGRAITPRARPRGPCFRRVEDPRVSFDSLSLPWLCVWLFLDGATISVATTPLLLLSAPHLVPWQVALAGGVASAAGSVVQLLLFRWMLAARHPWMARFVPTRERIEATLRRYPSASFLAIVIARATPLPDAPLKIVAAVAGYPPLRYFLAVLLGALPYYFALSWVGREFPLPRWAIVAVAAVFLAGLLADQVRRGNHRAGV